MPGSDFKTPTHFTFTSQILSLWFWFVKLYLYTLCREKVDMLPPSNFINRFAAKHAKSLFTIPSYLYLFIIPTYLPLFVYQTYLPIFVYHTYLPIFFLPYLPTYLCLAYLPTCLCLPYLPTYLCLPYLPIYLSLFTIQTYMPTYLYLFTIPTHCYFHKQCKIWTKWGQRKQHTLFAFVFEHSAKNFCPRYYNDSRSTPWPIK